jgi:hypothetical protein
MQWVLTLVITLLNFRSSPGLQLPKWGFPWECEGLFPHTHLHSHFPFWLATLEPLALVASPRLGLWQWALGVRTSWAIGRSTKSRSTMNEEWECIDDDDGVMEVMSTMNEEWECIDDDDSVMEVMRGWEWGWGMRVGRREVGRREGGR